MLRRGHQIVEKSIANNTLNDYYLNSCNDTGSNHYLVVTDYVVLIYSEWRNIGDACSSVILHC